jgi:hypothetical protein
MAKAIVVSMSVRGQNRFISLFAGEDLALQFEELPLGANAILTVALDFDAPPLVQRTYSTSQALLTAATLAVVPEGQGCVYAIWLEQNGAHELVWQGSFLMLDSVAPIDNSGATDLANLRTPVISGNQVVGQTLTLDTGDWQGATLLGVQWQRDGQPVIGQTLPAYSVLAGDEGQTISATVTGQDGLGGTLTISAIGGGLVVWPAPTVVQNLGPFTVVQGMAVSEDLSVAFAGSALSFSLSPASGSLPMGLSLSPGGLLVGTPTGSGGAVLGMIRATNSGGSADASFAITVVQAAGGLVVGQSTPRLIVEGDSILAIRPGARDVITGYLGDLVYFPNGWMQAASGQTTADILAGLQATVDLIVPNETIVLMGPMGANQTTGSGTVAEMWPQQSLVFDTLLAAGAVVVAIPTLPDEDSYGNNAEKDALRDLVYAYQSGGVVSYLGVDYTVTAHANFHAVDIGTPDRGQTGSAAYGTGAFNPYTMKTDQSHPNMDFGVSYLAMQVRATLRSLVSGSALPVAFDAANLLGGDWNFPGSATATGTGTTGQRPSGWTVARQSGSGTWTLSKDDAGNLVASITNAPDETILQVSRLVSFGGVLGDVFDLIAEIEVDPASTEYRGAAASFRGTGGATVAGASYGTPDFPLLLRTSGTPLPGSVGSDTAQITVALGPGGTATFTFKRAAIYLREAVTNELMISGNPDTAAQVGDSYAFTPTVVGGTAPYSFDLASGTLPDGALLNAATGAITGTLTAAGTYSGIVLRVTDSANSTDTLPAFAVIVTAASITGVARITTIGQSNAGTLGNSVDQLSLADVGVFPDQFSLDNTSNSAAPNPPMSYVPYVLARTGETFAGISGPYGERNAGQADGQPVGPTIGAAFEYRAGNFLNGSATRVDFDKYSSAGKALSHFQPMGETATYDIGSLDANKGYQYLCYMGKAQRIELSTLGAPIYRQFVIWAQGEANTNPARDSANIAHVSIISYPAEWQKIYDFKTKQEGPQPPWIIVQLLPVWNITEGARDVYTDAMNVQLRSLARYTINMVGGTFNSITDNGSGNPNVYYLQHDYVTKLTIQSADPHFSALEQKAMGVAMTAAMKALRGGNGWSAAFPIAEVRPVISGYGVTGGASLVTVSGHVSDPCTVYAVAVISGAATPTAAQIIAGTGGGIAAGASAVITDTTAGAAFTLDIVAMPTGSFDIHTVCQITTGEVSVLESAPATTTAAVLSWDETYRTDVIAYSNGNLTALHNSASGTFYIRGKPTSSTGKRYFEAVVGGTTPPPTFVGIGDFDIAIGGGTAGTSRAGWLAANVQYTGGNQSMGGALVLNDRVQIAFDLDARLIWMRRNNSGDWNNTFGANPVTGAGGLSIAGLDQLVIPVAGFGLGDGITLALASGQWVYAAPSGFGPIG